LKSNKCNQKSDVSLNKSKDENGFILSSTYKNKEILMYEKFKKKITNTSAISNMGFKKDDISGKTRIRLYTTYKDNRDNTSIIFICRILTKI
jgi:hypothetical protein